MHYLFANSLLLSCAPRFLACSQRGMLTSTYPNGPGIWQMRQSGGRFHEADRLPPGGGESTLCCYGGDEVCEPSLARSQCGGRGGGLFMGLFMGLFTGLSRVCLQALSLPWWRACTASEGSRQLISSPAVLSTCEHAMGTPFGECPAR